MKYFQETTVWPSNIPNHTYLLNPDKSKMYGYIRVGTAETKMFSQPMSFDARGRKFREVVELGEVVIEQPVKREAWQVQGSRGDTYTVERVAGELHCDCAGFKFRGQCRHVKEIKNVG